MRRGFGLGEKCAREEFELCFRDFATRSLKYEQNPTAKHSCPERTLFARR
jgi:hypothetical protein